MGELVRTRMEGLPGQQPGQRKLKRVEQNRPGQTVVEKFDSLLGDGLEVRRNSEFGIRMIGAVLNYYDAKYQVALTQEAMALPVCDEATKAELAQSLERHQAKQDRYKALLTLPDVFVGEENRGFFADVKEVVSKTDTEGEDAEVVRDVRAYLMVRRVATGYYEDILPESEDRERDPLDYFIDLNASFDRAAEATDDSYTIYSRAFKAVHDYYRAKSRLEEDAIREGDPSISDGELIRYLGTVFGRDVTEEQIRDLKIPEFKLAQGAAVHPTWSRQKRFDHISKTLDGIGNQDPLYRSIVRNFREDQDELEAGVLNQVQEHADIPESVQELAATVALVNGFKGMFKVTQEIKPAVNKLDVFNVLSLLPQVPAAKQEAYIRDTLPLEDAEAALRAVSRSFYRELNRSSKQSRRKPSLQTPQS